MKLTQKLLPGKLELIEAIPVIMESLSDLYYERYKIHKSKFDLKMIGVLKDRVKVWERIMELYPTAHESLIKNYS